MERRFHETGIQVSVLVDGHINRGTAVFNARPVVAGRNPSTRRAASVINSVSCNIRLAVLVPCKGDAFRSAQGGGKNKGENGKAKRGFNAIEPTPAERPKDPCPLNSMIASSQRFSSHAIVLQLQTVYCFAVFWKNFTHMRAKKIPSNFCVSHKNPHIWQFTVQAMAYVVCFGEPVYFKGIALSRLFLYLCHLPGDVLLLVDITVKKPAP